ncbi:GNAT family N-acetyltransferase [Kamptonema formosum]|uniref:GNAT family N-acetyltransferase n=1 Tax=Kamptonema formosum TaxID=331992 RepID=UPI0003451239|nr:GNAT family N-acetyltransferase [Oscillatoria sp. PCC 10802]
MDWIFGPIDESVRKEDFDCGVPELNDYLQKYARQNHRRGIATTFVAIPQDGDGRVAGYYSTSMGEIKRESLPEKYRRGLPRYPIPALRMGKLAVDQSMQGKGLGKELLMQCFRKAVRLSSEVGIVAVTVDALNEPAKQFYMKYGFIPLENDRLSLFIPLSTILRAIE